MSIFTAIHKPALAAASIFCPLSSAWAGILDGIAGGSGVAIEWIFILGILIVLLAFVMVLLSHENVGRFDRDLSESRTISDRDNRSRHVHDVSDSFDMGYRRRVDVILMVVVAAGAAAFIFREQLGHYMIVLVLFGVFAGIWLVAVLFGALGEAMGSTWPRLTDNVAKDEASRDHYRRDRH